MNNNNENSIHQPYEIIETEETITRYFNPRSKEPIYCTDDHTTHKRYRSKCAERKSCDQDDPKIVLKNCEFQDLYEKFNKLRTIMTELTDKFKEINLLKKQATNNLPAFKDAATRIENDISLSNCQSQNGKLPENREELKNCVFYNDIKDCNSRISVESQTENINHIEPTTPTLKEVIDDIGKCRNMNGGKECRDDSYPKRTEAALLRRSKKLLISLIDKELQKVQSGRKTFHNKKSAANDQELYSDTKYLKIECIDKITEELAVLKDLERIQG